MKNPKTPTQRPRKAPSNQTGGTAWGKKLAAEISRMAQATDMKKLILLNFPYIIAFGIRNFRLNLKNVCTDGICQIFSNFCGNTAGRKIGDKSFAHGNALPLDDFV